MLHKYVKEGEPLALAGRSFLMAPSFSCCKERETKRETLLRFIYLFIIFYHLNKMLVNRFKDELNEEELLFIQEIQNTDATLSRSKKLTTRQTLPRRPPESMLPAWVERLHACPDGGRVFCVYVV